MPTCAQGSSVLVTRIVGEWRFFGLVGFSLVPGAYGRGASFASSPPFLYTAQVTWVCLLLDTPFGRRSVGALPS